MIPNDSTNQISTGAATTAAPFQTETLSQTTESVLSSAELHVISEQMDTFGQGIQKIDNDLDAIANKLELIDNSFSDYFYSDPAMPEIHFDEVLDKLSQVQTDLTDIFQSVTPAAGGSEALKNLDTIPDISSAMERLNINFRTVLGHLNKITDHIIYFDASIQQMTESSKTLQADLQNQKQLLTQLTEMQKAVQAGHASMQSALLSVQTAQANMQSEIIQRLNVIETNSAKAGKTNPALILGVGLSVVLNIALLLMNFL